MKRKRFTEVKIVGVLTESEAGAKLSRKPQDFDVADGTRHSRCGRSESF